jgi:hypothetical protein
MAIATVDPVLAWRQVLNLCSLKSNTSLFVGVGVKRQLEALKSYLIQQGGNPDLLVVPFDKLSSTEVVIAAEACKLYALALYKDTSTATFTKATDSATTSSDAASELRIWQPTANKSTLLTYPGGLAFANGITMQGNTTADGGTGSALNGASGFAIIGAP